MSEFEFLNTITEAKYIRRTNDIIGKNEFDVAESFFEHLLVLQQLRFENPKLAKKYAKNTLRYMDFSEIRNGATDLHNLAAILANPDKFVDKISDAGSVHFDKLKFRRYLRDIIEGRHREGTDRTFLYQMQKNLGIRNSFLKQSRRVLADYGTSNVTERKSISSRMVNTFRQDGQFRSDIFKDYINTVKNNSLAIDPKDIKGKVPGWAKGAAALAGAAAAGYAFGRKFG